MDVRDFAAMRLPRQLASPVSQVALWQLDLKDPVVSLRAAANCLNAAERDHAAALRRPADRLRFVATRSALRWLLGQALDCELDCAPDALTLETGPHGKPMLAMPGAPAFNVSHAGDHAWIALTQGRTVGGEQVGVDIEWMDPALDRDTLRGMTDHCLTPRERAWLELLPPPAWRHGFFTLWTAKEAVLKALGVGIADYLQHVSVMPGADGAVRRHVVLPEPGQGAGMAPHEAALARIQLYGLQAPAGYAAAMAWLPPA
ncbi:4'-phosphopantetheinyl transferase superfamily protein [Cupriavidus sp. D384]|uniref:4'-phosphopantetheinyl transferase family protein n=1 Tax=Cupriavidus sp. D384 TaxID=1538095 RepID=UPI000A80B268|nr:4'-phosphopantetheinyl transferase superfamily protein [Cupriavidus sp. D384]